MQLIINDIMSIFHAEFNGIFIILFFVIVQSVLSLLQKITKKGHVKGFSPDEIFEKVFGLEKKQASYEEQVAEQKVRDEIMQLKRARRELAGDLLEKSDGDADKHLARIRQIEESSALLDAQNIRECEPCASAYLCKNKASRTIGKNKVRSWIIGSVIIGTPKSRTTRF